MIPLTVMADVMLAACVDVATIHGSIADAREQGRSEAEVLVIAQRTMPLDIYQAVSPGVYRIYNMPAERVRPMIQDNYEKCVADTDAYLQELAAQERSRQNW